MAYRRRMRYTRRRGGYRMSRRRRGYPRRRRARGLRIGYRF